MKKLVKSFLFVSSILVGVARPIPDQVEKALVGYVPQQDQSVTLLIASIRDSLDSFKEAERNKRHDLIGWSCA